MGCHCVSRACLHNICHVSTVGIVLYCLGTALYVVSYITPQWSTLTCRQAVAPDRPNVAATEVLLGYSGIYEDCLSKDIKKHNIMKDIKALSIFTSCGDFVGMSSLACSGMVESPVFLTSVKFLMAVALGGGVVLAGILVKSRCIRTKRGHTTNGIIFIALMVPAVLGIVGDAIYSSRQQWGDHQFPSFVIVRQLSWSFYANSAGCGLMLLTAIFLLVVDRWLAIRSYNEADEEEQRAMLKLDIQQAPSTSGSGGSGGSGTEPRPSGSIKRSRSGSKGEED